MYLKCDVRNGAKHFIIYEPRDRDKGKFQSRYHDVSALDWMCSLIVQRYLWINVFSLTRCDQQLRTKEIFNQHLPQSLRVEYAISHSESLVINYFAF